MEESKRISGNRKADDLVKAYYIELYKPKPPEKIEPEKPREPEKTEPKLQPKITTTNLNDPQNYILLPGAPQILVAKNRLSYSPEVEQAAKKLGLTLQNNNQGYIGNINWNQAQGLLSELNSFMLNPSFFATFLKLLKTGTAYDGAGNKVNSSELEQILNEIIELRNPWRYEWLDNIYSKQRTKLFTTYHKFNSSGNLIEVTEQLDPDTMMQTKTPGISLEEWINNPNSQGLPRANIKDGKLYYWNPTEGRVAGFYADADWSDLDCDGNPSGSYVGLGVRAAKIFGGNP